MLPVIGTFGPYDVLGRLAVGGMAEVLLARPRGTSGRPLVVKKILSHFADDDDFRAMFEDEAKLGLLLDHPNIVRCSDRGAVDGQPYLEMEWVDGVPLGRLIRRARDFGGVPDRLAVTIGAKVADALAHAHQLVDEDGRPLNLVHRDISPHNVMISYDGEVKLLDFGIAKAEARQHETRAGVVKGKFAYMAPEQIRAESIDARADLFALGVVLFESLIGKSLYRRETDAETMNDILDGAVPMLSGYVDAPSRELEAALRKALAKDARERFQSAAAFRDALLSWLRGHGGPASAREISELVARCFAAEAERGPRVDTMPFGQSVVLGAPPRPSAPSGTRELDLEIGELDLPPIDLAPRSSHRPTAAPKITVSSGDPFDPLAGPPLDVAPLKLDTPAAVRASTPRPAPTPASRPARVAPPRPVPSTSSGGSRMWLVALSVVAVLALGAVGVFVWKPWAEPAAEVDDASRATPLPRTGSAILVTSLPAGAQVTIDGEPRGSTPLEIPGLEPGEHVVVVSAEGFDPHEQTVTLGAGATETVMARLEEAATVIDPETADGSLTFETDPPTEVFVGRVSLGRTPLRRVQVPSGALRVELVDADGLRYRTRIPVRGGGEETRAFVRLADLERQ
ncbi:MAG: protein kinase [Polyangiales bacterium]